LASKKIPATYLKNPLHFLSLGFGTGLAPFAPGTFGTLAAIPLYWIAHDLPLTLFLLLIAAGFIFGVYLCAYTSRALGVHDHSGIVWDEIVGYFITMIAVPFDWRWVLVGFVLFRVFDIVKPWPIRWIDKQLQGGFGIMFDDVVAGLFALIALHFIIYLSSLVI
jgi:phosphatidylglycerophosphatase A